MALHFDDTEFGHRMNRMVEAMQASGLEAMLLFNPASQFWLTGYDTFGYCFFQCLIVDTNGNKTLLTRSADRLQAQLTSTIDDIRIWRDSADADPAADLARLLLELGHAGRTVGIEIDNHGLTYANGSRIYAALEDTLRLRDESRLVDRLRIVKSPAELACVRKAGELSDAALHAAVDTTEAGADEGLILANMHHAIFSAGGDYPGNPFIIGSGREALLCRYKSGRRVLDSEDQLTLEYAGVWRHYHAAAMNTLIVGAPSDQHKRMFDSCIEAIHAAEATLRPGSSMSEVYQAQADVHDRHGFGAQKLFATGYSLGTVFAPSWMDWPMFYEGNAVLLEPGMVMFLHMILFDSDTNTAMTFGRTSIITDGRPELLNNSDDRLYVL